MRRRVICIYLFTYLLFCFEVHIEVFIFRVILLVVLCFKFLLSSDHLSSLNSGASNVQMGDESQQGLGVDFFFLSIVRGYSLCPRSSAYQQQPDAFPVLVKELAVSSVWAGPWSQGQTVHLESSS